MTPAQSRIVLCAAALLVIAPPALAQEWQKIGEAPWRAFHLNADQPGVSYDEGSYKFYVSENQSLGPNRSLIVQAQSGDFEPDILVWNSAGSIVARCRPDSPFTGAGGILVHGCTVEVSQQPAGNYTVVTTTRDIDQGMVTVQWSLWELPGGDPLAETDDEATTDTRIRRCQELAAAERAQCLAAISQADLDPTACDFDPTGVCRQQVAAAVMQKCQTLTDELKRETCFMEVASGWKDPDSCAYADEPQHCIVTVAAETQDPNLIVDRFGDDPDYDAWMMMYGTLSGDLYAAELMRDNQKADYATIMIGTIMLARGGALPPDFCTGLRGGYAEGNEDLDIESMADLCRGAIARAADLVARLANASEEEQQAILEEFMRQNEAIASGEADWEDLVPPAPAPPPLVVIPDGGYVDAPVTGSDEDCVSLLGQGC